MVTRTAPTDPSRRARVALVSIAVNALLTSGELALGLATGSVALVADAIHSFSDMVVSVLVLLGVWIGKRRPHLALVVEHIVALCISTFILAVSGRIIFELAEPTLVVRKALLPIAIVASLVFVLMNGLLASYQDRAGRATRSPSLLAEGRHTLSDMFTSMAVVIALLGQVIGLPLDRPVGVLIAAVVGFIGLEMLLTALLGLLSARLSIPASGSSALGRATRFVLGRKIVSWLERRWRLASALVLLVVLAGWGLSGMTLVAPDERGVVLRFGERQGDPLSPGGHWLAPWPIDELVRIQPDAMRHLDIGFRRRGDVTSEALLVRTSYEWDSLHDSGILEWQQQEALSLTGDENLVDVTLVVQYSFDDPLEALMVSDSEKLVRSVVEAAMHELVAQLAFEDSLVSDREKIEQEILRRAQSVLDDLDSGIAIRAIYLQDVHPPVEVLYAFRDVYSAQEEQETVINDAYGYRYKEIANARSEAYRRRAEATAYETAVVNRATGDGTRFRMTALAHFIEPELYELRLRLELLEEVLEGKRKVILPGSMAPKSINLRFVPPGGRGR